MPGCLYGMLLTLGFLAPLSGFCGAPNYSVFCRPMSKLESQQPRPLTLGLPTRPR